MARNQRPHLLFALFIAATLAASFLVNSLTTVQATLTASDPVDIQVDHTVEIRKGGSIVINDTVKLSAETGQNIALASFLLGFPYVYQQNLDDVYAYDSSNTQLKINPNVGLGKIGFYGVEVELD
ncbi:MAG: hypothetical protein ACETVM_01125, partial [Candidatus Bathyarchaeia archaeon]